MMITIIKITMTIMITINNKIKEDEANEKRI